MITSLEVWITATTLTKFFHLLLLTNNGCLVDSSTNFKSKDVKLDQFLLINCKKYNQKQLIER